jgi:hypothetical protein
MQTPDRCNHRSHPDQPRSVPLMCKQCRKLFAGNITASGTAVCPRCETEWVKDPTVESDNRWEDNGVD